MANIFFSIEKIILFKKRKKENGALSRKRVEQGKQLTEEQLLAGGGEGRLCAGTPKGWSGRGGARRVTVPLSPSARAQPEGPTGAGLPPFHSHRACDRWQRLSRADRSHWAVPGGA